MISNFKLAVGFPLGFPLVRANFFWSWLHMECPAQFIPLREDNGPIDNLRNNMVKRALECGATHLIMMDTDMSYHPKTITRLLSHNKPVVGALCYRRYPPFDPIMLRGDPLEGYEVISEWEDGELVQVDATGTGCLMFDMQVFKDMPGPWFRFRPNPSFKIGGIIGEDIGFSWDLRRAGYGIHVDTSVPAGHITDLEVNDATFRLFAQMQTEKHKKSAAAALGGGG